MKIKSIYNKITHNTFPGGVFGENFEKHCLNNPEEFVITYHEEESDSGPEKYSAEVLKAFSMPNLRDIYKRLSEGVENPPPPTTSVDGIIKAIVKLQGE